MDSPVSNGGMEKLIRRRNVPTEDRRKKYYDKIVDSIVEDIVCIVEVDNEKHTYHVSEWDECFQEVFKQDGSLRDLYCALFSRREQQSGNTKNEYDKFIDEEVFQKEKYQGSICFKINGEEKNYFFRFLKISLKY